MTSTSTFVEGLAFAEGPRWHDGSLWLSDMHRHRVLRVDDAGGVEVVLQHDSPVSGLGWLPDGSLLTVAMEGEVLRDGEPFADVRHLAHHGVNDMISHPEGWSWVGQFGYDRHQRGQRPEPSPLLRVDPDGATSVAAEDLLVANGMALTPDGGTLLVAESAGMRVTAFTVGGDGTLHDRRTFAEVPPPDGMCLDAEGAVWIAGVTVGAFLRVAPGGEVLDRIDVEEEGRRAIACVLGGPDRRSLFLLTATTTGEAEPSLAAMAARVERAEVHVPGAGWP
jgi:sugar lactone lactonase YvrE